MGMSFLQGLGGVGAGLMTAKQILRQQRQDEISNRLKTSQAGLADVQLKNANKALENEAAYGEIASKEPGTQTVLRADAPADEWGQQQTETVGMPNRRAGFDAMAQEALKRGDQAGYEKFTRYGEHLKKQQDEGVTDIAKMVHSGTVDLSAAEKSFNNAGTMRVLPGSTKWDAATGTLSGIDAATGKPISMDKNSAQQHLIMSGNIKPDEYGSAGDGRSFNKRTGKVEGQPRSISVAPGHQLVTIDPVTGKVTGGLTVPATKQWSTLPENSPGLYDVTTGATKPLPGADKGAPSQKVQDDRVKMAIDKVVMPKFGGKFEGGLFFPDEKNKDVALASMVRLEQYIKQNMDPVEAGNKAIKEAERDAKMMALTGNVVQTGKKQVDVKSIMTNPN